MTKFHHLWGHLRALVIVLFLIWVITAAIQARAFTLDIEFRPPLGEIDRLDKATKEKEEKKAFDKRSKKEKITKKEKKQAKTYAKKNSA